MYVPIDRIAAALILLLTVLAAPSQAAGFDCARAIHQVEKMICASPELSSLDQAMADAYRSALAGSGSAAQVRSAQRTWLREVRNRCQTTACLVDAYKQRIAAMAQPDPPPPIVAAAHPPATAAAKPAGAPHECDTLAAHPQDPESYAAGIADDKLDAQAVIRACAAALQAEPHTPRLHFQLARGYLKANTIGPAIEHLIAAGQQGHGAAIAFLADLHVAGAPGIEADPVLARSLYQRAVTYGFAPASKILAEFEDKTDEYAKAEREGNIAAATPGAHSSQGLTPYLVPEVIDNIFLRKFDDIPSNESWTKEYLVNIADNIRAICESNFTQQEVKQLKAAADADRFNLGQAAVTATMMGSMAMLAQALKNPNAFMSQPAGAAADPFEAGMKDTEALFQRHMCKTPGLAQFAKNLKAYVQNDEAPLPAPDAIMNACLQDPPPSKYKASDFCLCFAGGLNNARVSQGHRKGLTKNFKETAIKLMNIDRNRAQFQVCRSGL